jgi:hypothetical protein
MTSNTKGINVPKRFEMFSFRVLSSRPDNRKNQIIIGFVRILKRVLGRKLKIEYFEVFILFSGYVE